MKDQKIIYLSQYIFGLFFLLGSICLLGAILTKLDSFAVGGCLLFAFGTIANVLVAVGLLIYGLIHKSKFDTCLKAIDILLLSIPVAILFYVIIRN